VTPTVLLVDDDQSIRMVATINLEASGIRVVEAADGNAALRAIGEEAFDLVLLDVMMPGMSGWDVAAALRGEASPPIVFVSAKSSAADRIRGYELGAIEYVTKPFDPVTLSRRVLELIESAELGEAGPAARMELERLLEAEAASEG
jgi:DNA-binding response OmpR family regulator